MLGLSEWFSGVQVMMKAVDGPRYVRRDVEKMGYWAEVLLGWDVDEYIKQCSTYSWNS